jgi:hypothetical protein
MMHHRAIHYYYFDREALPKYYQQPNIWVVHRLSSTTYWGSSLDFAHGQRDIAAHGNVEGKTLDDDSQQGLRAIEKAKQRRNR